MTEPTLFDLDTPAQRARKAAKELKKTASSPSWFPKTNGEMLMRGYQPGSGALHKCRARDCGQLIEFWTTPSGRTIPMNQMPTPETPAVAHYATCTDPNRFRKGKPKP